MPVLQEVKTVETLVKFSSSEYINSLRQVNLYMNSVEYFRRCDSLTHSDLYEGADFLHQADIIQSILIESPSFKKITLSKDTGLKNFMAGKDSNYCTNIFCMYLWRIYKDQPNKNKIDHRLFSFGDTALIMLNSNEFINRVKRAVKSKNYYCTHGNVKYFDEHIYSGEVGLFRKRKSLEYMNEYRIAVNAEMNYKPYTLSIGDISDISIIIKSQDINKFYGSRKHNSHSKASGPVTTTLEMSLFWR